MIFSALLQSAVGNGVRFHLTAEETLLLGWVLLFSVNELSIALKTDHFLSWVYLGNTPPLVVSKALLAQSLLNIDLFVCRRRDDGDLEIDFWLCLEFFLSEFRVDRT